MNQIALTDLEILKGGGVAAFHDYFCPPFGPESGGGVAALKTAKMTFFGKIFRPKGGGGCNSRNPSPRSANG